MIGAHTGPGLLGVGGARRLAAVLVALCLVSASSASADPYVSLGDSIGAGQGATSTSKGFVSLLYAHLQTNLGATQLVNLAQPGQTSGGLLTAQLPTALADINAADDTKAVTIEIGANDLLQNQCPSGFGDPGCQTRNNLASALGQLQTALAGDPGSEPLVAMEYYNPATGTGSPSETSYDLKLLGANGTVGLTDTGADVGLDDVIYQEAAATGIPVADPYPAFKAAGQSYISADHLHPNDVGYAAIDAAFCAVLPAGTCDPAAPPPPPPPDTTPPETTITKDPAKRIDKNTARYRFSSSEEGSTFLCKLDHEHYRNCDSPKILHGLDRGRHKFSVRATDAAGNADPSPATDRFRVVG